MVSFCRAGLGRAIAGSGESSAGECVVMKRAVQESMFCDHSDRMLNKRVHSLAMAMALPRSSFDNRGLSKFFLESGAVNLGKLRREERFEL